MTINKFIKDNKDGKPMEDVGDCIQRCKDEGFTKKQVWDFYKRVLKQKTDSFSGLRVLAKALIKNKINKIYSKKA